MATTALFQTLTTTLTASLDPGAAAAAAGDNSNNYINNDDNSFLTSVAAGLITTLAPTLMPPGGGEGGGGGGSGGGRPPPPDYLLHTRFVCDRVLVPLVVTLGIVGNVLSLAVLTRKEMASPTNCFLTALAISDVSLLLLQLPMFFGLSAALAGDPAYRLFVRYYTVIMYVMTNVFLTCTCWLTVAVTVERFLSLRFMMHPRLVCTQRRAKLAILAIFLASFLFHFSKFFEYVPNADLSSPRPLLPTALSLNQAYDVAMHVANISLAALIPMAALVLFNSFLVYFLATHRRKMIQHKKGACGLVGGGAGGAGSTGGGASSSSSYPSSSSSSSSGVDMVHVSGVVVAVVLVFVACHSLGVFVALNIAVHGRHVIFSDHLFVAFKHVNGLLVMLNSSLNFLIYCSISRKFRAMFATVFCKRFRRRGGGKAGTWSLPGGGGGGGGGGPLSDNSMATAVSVRGSNPHQQRSNGFSSRGGSRDNSKDTSFVRASPSNSSSGGGGAMRAVDHAAV